MSIYGSVLGLPTEPREPKKEGTTESSKKPITAPAEKNIIVQSGSLASGVNSDSLIRQRILRILGLLKAKGKKGLTASIISFWALTADTFGLETNFPNSKTSLRYETSGNDEVLRIELTHAFGELDLSKSDNPVQFLAEMLGQNVPSFRDSGACLGLQSASPHPIVSLNSTHQFLTTMADEDITEIISIAIFDLKMGMLFQFPDEIVLWY